MKLIVIFTALLLFVYGCGKTNEEESSSTDSSGHVGKIEISPLKVPSNSVVKVQLNLEAPGGEVIVDYYVGDNKISAQNDKELENALNDLPEKTPVYGVTINPWDSKNPIKSDPVYIILPINLDDIKAKIKDSLVKKRIEILHKEAVLIWYVGDEQILYTGFEMVPKDHNIKRGSKIYVTLKDPTSGKVYKSKVVDVINSLPKIESLTLTTIDNQDIKAVVVTKDDDEDEVKLTYEWMCGGNVVKDAKDAVLDHTLIGQSKDVSVTVIADDGFGKSQPSVAKLNASFKNAVPTITSTPSTTINNGVYTYQVTAQDEDMDSLTFSLESAPSGMSIDPKTGLVTWTLPKDVGGDYTFKVIVDDGKGGKISQSVPLVVEAGKPGEPKKEEKKEEKPLPFGSKPPLKHKIGKDFSGGGE
jgi:hypothetical protein